MPGGTHVDIGLNGAFMTRRYDDPENWVQIVKSLGFDNLSFDSDALDPFFSGDMQYILEVAKRTGKIAKEKGLGISDYFTGYASYRFFGLAHREEPQRRRMLTWMEDAIKLAAAMGAKGMGGRCDAYSVETLNNPVVREERYHGVIDAYRTIARQAKALGLSAVYFEQMYVPSLIPHTIKETYDFIRDANKDLDGVPVRPVVDVGHCCGGAYGLTGEDMLYEKWIERFGAACNLIHIQQTKRISSDHMAFSSGYRGDIEIERIIESLSNSVKRAGSEPWAEHLAPSKNIVLVLEVLPSTKETEEAIYDQLAQSNAYLRRAIPKGGIDL